MDIDYNKLEESMVSLENACPENMDIADVIAIVIDDIADMFKAKSSRQFMKQKRDARNTIKVFKRRFENMTFKNIKK